MQIRRRIVTKKGIIEANRAKRHAQAASTVASTTSAAASIPVVTALVNTALVITALVNTALVITALVITDNDAATLCSEANRKAYFDASMIANVADLARLVDI